MNLLNFFGTQSHYICGANGDHYEVYEPVRYPVKKPKRQTVVNTDAIKDRNGEFMSSMAKENFKHSKSMMPMKVERMSSMRAHSMIKTRSFCHKKTLGSIDRLSPQKNIYD